MRVEDLDRHCQEDSVLFPLSISLRFRNSLRVQSKGKMLDAEFVFQEKGKENKPQNSSNTTPTAAKKRAGGKNSSI
eukprot:g38357.t1